MSDIQAALTVWAVTALVALGIAIKTRVNKRKEKRREEMRAWVIKRESSN